MSSAAIPPFLAMLMKDVAGQRNNSSCNRCEIKCLKPFIGTECLNRRACYTSIAMPDPQSSARDRRNYFRMTIVLPASIQRETDTAERVLTERSINLSAGGIGFVSELAHQPGEILAITLGLQEQVLFKAQAEVLRQDSLPSRVPTYRIHARFVRMSDHDRELLIGHIMRLQRAHLHEHYSA